VKRASTGFRLCGAEDFGHVFVILSKVTVSLPKSNSIAGEQTRSSQVRSMERYHENANCCCGVRHGVCCTGFRPVHFRPVHFRMGIEWRVGRAGQGHVRVRRRVVQQPSGRSVESPRRAARPGLCSDETVMAFEHVLDALQLQCHPGEPVVPDQLQLNSVGDPARPPDWGPTPWAASLSMRPAFEPAASSLTARKPSLPYVETLQRIKHVVVNSTNVTSLPIYANSIADKQTRSSRNRSHDDVYRDHDGSCHGARP